MTDPANIPSSATYDAFISYSHAADGLLAPRLQAGLQRFAKPWWKRRAIRIFRDESSLSANPHLWASITEALDTSGWFILLLSREAAQSEWVNNEIEYWREHKPAERILPVVTDGEFGWDGTGSAFPPGLADAFPDEPRWVDLRWAGSDEQLDLNNARFRSVVADIASTVRGVAKDELESEEVRQHRRTVRTAWGAGLLLVLLSTAAVALAFQSNRNEIKARAEALAASAQAVSETDPELAVLLAVQSLRLDPTPNGRSALHRGLQAHRTIASFPAPPGFEQNNIAAATISPEGDTIVIVDRAEVQIWDGSTFEMRASLRLFPEDAKAQILAFVAPLFSSDGTVVAIPVDASFETEIQPPETGIYTVDVRNGDVLSFEPIECLIFAQPAGGRYFDPGGKMVVQTTSVADRVGCQAPASDISILDLSTGETNPVGTVEGSGDGVPTLSADASIVAFGGAIDRQVVDVSTGNTLRTFENFGPSTLSPDGGEILTGHLPLERRSVDTGELLQSYQGLFSHAWFSPDGTQVIATARQTGTIMVFDTETGEQTLELRGHQTRPSDAVMTRDGSLIVSSAFNEGPRLWNAVAALGDLPNLELDLAEGTTIGPYLGGIQLGEDYLFTNSAPVVGRWDAPTSYEVRDRSTMEIIRERRVWAASISPDETIIVEQPILAEDVTSPAGVEGSTHIGNVRVVDTKTGDVLRDLESCEWFWHRDSAAPEPGFGCNLEQIDRFGDLIISDNGSTVLGYTWDASARLWSIESGESLWRTDRRLGDDFTGPYPIAAGLSPDGSTAAVYEVRGGFQLTEVGPDGEAGRGFLITQPAHQIVYSADGGRLFMADLAADLVIVDTGSWTEIARLQRGQGGSLRDVALSPDERFAATAGFDNFVRIWDLRTSSIVEEIEVIADLPRGLTDVEYLDANTLLVASPDFEDLLVFTIDPQRLIESAIPKLTRSFTDQECETYRIDPCPTLEEVHNG